MTVFLPSYISVFPYSLFLEKYSAIVGTQTPLNCMVPAPLDRQERDPGSCPQHSRGQTREPRGPMVWTHGSLCKEAEYL